MLNLLTKKKENNANFKAEELTILLSKLTQIYQVDDINQNRKKYLKDTINKFGYLPYPQYKVLQELTNAETIFCLIEKLKKAKTFVDGKFIDFKNPSVLSRNNVKDSSWFYQTGHNIKLLSLSALGDGNASENAGKFIDWVKCLITLPVGNIENGIYPTTLYLIPFFEREFDCAYLPKTNNISSKLQDDNLLKFLGLEVDRQVKLFIELAQLANHPVIYDILPQTARFSKMVLANPDIARWVDVDELISEITGYVNAMCAQILQNKKYDYEDVMNTQKLYIQNLKGNYKKYNALQQKIVDEIEEELKEYKILVSYKMSFKDKQISLQRKAEEIIARVNKKPIKGENDIINQDDIVKALIKANLWTFPGGAWCSSGVPIFDKMSKGAQYPTFKHYNYKGEDVTHFANLDCQTPFYFYHFELNKYNNEVVDFYVDYTEQLQKEFNFDGFRVDHIDHIVDEFSQDKKGQPLSYRTPAKVLGKVNSNLKKKIPYFATLAEYMLWDGYFKEYHKDMKFDLLWGDDIVAQNTKTVEQIINDNIRLSTYNQKNSRKNNYLSILRGYNNQDGEFRDINQYPGQLGAEGALFKWFKMKFLPGGKFAPRPTLLIDGDESFTKVGIERIISKEVSMVRNYDWNFFEKFNAIDYFAQNDELLTKGKAILHNQESNGFVCWEVVADSDKKSKNNDSSTYLIVANYFSPQEIKEVQDEQGKIEKKNVRGTTTKNNTVKLKKNKKLVSYFDFELDENGKCMLVEKPLENDIKNEITFKELRPAEFKIYRMK